MARILICDDSVFIRKFIAKTFVAAGHEVIAQAEDAQEVIGLYAKHKPDLVTMDIVLKGKSGIEAVKEIMNIDANAKVVIISSIGTQAMIVESIQAGVGGFVLKPFSPETLIAEARRILG